MHLLRKRAVGTTIIIVYSRLILNIFQKSFVELKMSVDLYPSVFRSDQIQLGGLET